VWCGCGGGRCSGGCGCSGWYSWGGSSNGSDGGEEDATANNRASNGMASTNSGLDVSNDVATIGGVLSFITDQSLHRFYYLHYQYYKGYYINTIDSIPLSHPYVHVNDDTPSRKRIISPYSKSPASIATTTTPSTNNTTPPPPKHKQQPYHHSHTWIGSATASIHRATDTTAPKNHVTVLSDNINPYTIPIIIFTRTIFSTFTKIIITAFMTPIILNQTISSTFTKKIIAAFIKPIIFT